MQNNIHFLCSPLGQQGNYISMDILIWTADPDRSGVYAQTKFQCSQCILDVHWQCTLCIHCSGPSVAPVQLYTGLLSILPVNVQYTLNTLEFDLGRQYSCSVGAVYKVNCCMLQSELQCTLHCSAGTLHLGLGSYMQHVTMQYKNFCCPLGPYILVFFFFVTVQHRKNGPT